MKITSQNPRCRHSRAGCNPSSNQQKVTKLAKGSVFRTSLIRVNSCDSWALRFFGGAPSPRRASCGRALPILIFLSLSLFCTISFAQTPDSVAEREVHRRQTGISQGEAALARGQAAMKAKDYATAHEEFRTAVTYLPDAVVSGKAHDEAVEGFCKSGVVLAEARIGQEKINNTKYKYGEEAYNETRSRQLWQVEKGWEQPVRRYGAAGEPAKLGIQKNLTDTARLNNKLNTIIIPRVEFRDATLREAVNFLREQAVENDPATEGERGIN